MKISLIAAKSINNVIGNGPDIPWSAKGEQLLFKALTYNHWLLVGRKTFQSMGELPKRKYAVVSRQGFKPENDNIKVFVSIDDAMEFLNKITDHVFVSGGGQIYESMIKRANTLHLSTIKQEVEGDISFPPIPNYFDLVFEQDFESNIDYKYQIWRKVKRN
ncbi:MAG: trimethoprim-resistant dihydrofolate reductase DfrA [Oleiphilus sp.]